MRQEKRIRVELAEALLRTEPEEGLDDRFSRIPSQSATRALLSFLSSADGTFRSRSATALGRLVAERARSDLDGAREIVRRLMWSLNDESGGIGWGAPEGLAHILARSDSLCEEFAPVFLSYLRQDGNFLGGSPLEPLLLTAAGILAQARPETLRFLGAERLLTPFLRSPLKNTRELASRALAFLRGEPQEADVLPQQRTACRSVSPGARSRISNPSK